MIRSMTGFGEAEEVTDAGVVPLRSRGGGNKKSVVSVSDAAQHPCN